MRSNPSFISYSTLLLEYSTVPFFSPFIILSTFIVLIFPVFLFQFIMSSSSLPLSPPIITFLSFGLLTLLFFLYPFPTILFLSSLMLFLALLVLIMTWWADGFACFGVALCYFALFCEHLYNSINLLMGIELLSQPVDGELSPTNGPIIIRTHKQQESQHNPHRAHS